MSEIERRYFEFDAVDDLIVETRADGRAAIVGYAAVYNRLSLDLGPYREMILPGAFDRVLNRERGRQDVLALFNHNSDIVLGRTSSGTLELSSDSKGLRYVVTPPVSRADVLELVQRRDLKGSSFAFTVEPKGAVLERDDKGNPVRHIREVSGLYDVGPVMVPAYPASTVGVAMRSYQAWLSSQQAEPMPEPRSLVPYAAIAAALRLRSQMRG
jgi:HK97 family phage prohead protease